MGVLTDYFRAADAATVVSALDRTSGMSPVDSPVSFDGVEAKGIEPTVVLGQLVAAARRTEWTVDSVRSELVWPADPESADEGPWVVELHSSVRDTFAGIDDADLPSLASRWAEIEEFGGHASEDDLLPLVTELVTLARRAHRAGEQLYCWMTL